MVVSGLASEPPEQPATSSTLASPTDTDRLNMFTSVANLSAQIAALGIIRQSDVGGASRAGPSDTVKTWTSTSQKSP
jgi:hypothetical protein